jgi:hypothetical protein|tara:strand:- start:1625 stop:1762 length:138 start_codon:yes stop_codon:yes gene_type:complete
VARKINAFAYLKGSRKRRPGVHAKTKSSSHTKSKHYKKNYKGQGR